MAEISQFELSLIMCTFWLNRALIVCNYCRGPDWLLTLQAILEFSPNHLVNHSHVALNYLHDFRADILVCVVRNRCAVVSVLDKFYGSLYRLEQTIGVDAGEDESGFVEGFRTFSGGADADGRERMAYAGEE